MLPPLMETCILGCNTTHFHRLKGKSLSSQLAVLTRASAAGASQWGRDSGFAPLFSVEQGGYGCRCCMPQYSVKATNQQFPGYLEDHRLCYTIFLLSIP